jgi:hypothetical protein
MERRFTQEFLAELARDPRALKDALLADRARWLRGLRQSGREELLFELEMLLRGIELCFGRRHVSTSGRALLGQDFSDELRVLRDGLHRAASVARRLLLPAAEQNFQFRAYLERHVAEEPRRSRLVQELSEQRSPEESLFVLRQQLRALQGLSEQLLRQPVAPQPAHVSYSAFDDLAVLGEYILASSRYFRPPGALEFRTEYDRVGSVRLLDLVKRLSDARARKSLALGFLACFRLLRYLRFVPVAPTPLPRRAVLVLLLVRDESLTVAGYLASDLKRLTASSAEAKVIAAAGEEAARHLRDAVARLPEGVSAATQDRAALDAAREALSEGAKSAASALTQAAEPNSSAAEIFDGQRARRERAERLRKDLWICRQLLRDSMDVLLPAMRGEPAQAFHRMAALQRFMRDFRQVGYYLLRPGDHDPFDRFYGGLEALLHTAPSPARDRHLYLEIRRFLTVADRGYALVNRRAELLEIAFDPDAASAELDGYRATAEILDPATDARLVDAVMSASVEDTSSSVEITPTADEADAMLQMLGEPMDEPSLEPAVQEPEATPGPRDPITDPGKPSDGEEETFDPEETRRIWR